MLTDLKSMFLDSYAETKFILNGISIQKSYLKGEPIYIHY